MATACRRAIPWSRSKRSTARSANGTPATGSPGDIFALDISDTGAATAGTATLFFDASDAGLDTAGEQISAFSTVVDLDGSKKDPKINLAGSTLTFTEGNVPLLVAAGGQRQRQRLARFRRRGADRRHHHQRLPQRSFVDPA